MEDFAVYGLVLIVVYIGIMLLFRELVCWYFKINRMVESDSYRNGQLNIQNQVLTDLVNRSNTEISLLQHLCDQKDRELEILYASYKILLDNSRAKDNSNGTV